MARSPAVCQTLALALAKDGKDWHQYPMNRVFILVGLVFIAACNLPPTGLSAAYVWPAEKIDVVMPPNARSIRQQYKPAPSADRFGEAHLGIDVIGPPGDPILAPAPGRVIASFIEPFYGTQLILEHGPDASGRTYRTRYWHLQSRDVKRGDAVARGQKIAGLGRSGVLAAGILHLHFEVLQEVSPGRFETLDPQLLWIDGVGRVTCFEPGRTYSDRVFRMTYPVECL